MNLNTLLRTNLDRAIAALLVFLGGVLLVLGWIGVSGHALAPEQIPYLISGGLGGVLLGAIGCTAWLSADLQDEWRRLDSLEDRLTELVATQQELHLPPAPSVARQNGRSRSTRAKSTAH
jgi:hypothetical protein